MLNSSCASQDEDEEEEEEDNILLAADGKTLVFNIYDTMMEIKLPIIVHQKPKKTMAKHRYMG